MGERRGPIIAGVILVVIGALLLVRETLPGVDVGGLWPVASVVLGLVLVVLSIRPARRDV